MNIQEIQMVLRTFPCAFYGGNLYDENEIIAASRVIFNKSPFRHYGLKCTHEADQFEKECREYFGVRYAHTTNSGTGALMAALHALDVGPGDEVIMPGFLWVSDSNTVLLRGAIPVMCEINATLNMDPIDLEKKITKKTKCVIAIHMTGVPADIDAIMSICKPRKIKVLEDLSQCVGGAVKGRKLGGIGDIGIASLQLNKMITSGEGGLILTKSENYYQKVTARTDLGYPRVGGISKNTGEDANVTVGEGRRFNEVSAAIMREQLKKLPEMLIKLRAIKKRMKDYLRGKGQFKFRTIIDEKGDPGSMLSIIFNGRDERVRFQSAAEKLFPHQQLRAGALVDMGLHIYYNCSNLVKKMPALPGGFPWNLPENRGNYSYDKGTLPRTDDLLERSMHMNIPPDLNDIQIDAWLAGFDAVFAQTQDAPGKSATKVREPALVA
jgi:8-amino-3,8-dideoxy-alpha-D-manno-octulosonate transaminase